MTPQHAHHKQGIRTRLLLFPILTGILWAGLWGCIYALVPLMDVLETMGENPATVVGHSFVFYALTACYVAQAVAIPALIWMAVPEIRESRWPTARKILLTGYIIGMPIVVGLGGLAVAGRMVPRMAQAWQDWQQGGFAVRQLSSIAILVWVSSVLRNRTGRKPAPG